MNVVVVPVYKNYINDDELVSLSQLKAVLYKQAIIFCAPKRLEDSLPQYLAGEQVIYFADEFFVDISGYNQLLTSKIFYAQFTNFEYMLIYQLDAFVFKDELDYWSSKEVDYIGAPFTFDLSKFLSPNKQKLLPFIHRFEQLKYLRKLSNSRFLVGNGGFSLRRIATFIHILDTYSIEISQYFADEMQNLPNEANALHEDLFWSFFVPQLDKKFKKAPFADALAFAFEVDPKLCYELNNHKLPFGCHGWSNHDTSFWRDSINKFGYHV